MERNVVPNLVGCRATSAVRSRLVCLVSGRFQIELTDAIFVCRYNFDLNKGPISIEWFKGAQTNIAYNCLDRHVKAGKGDKIAMYWEGNDLNVDDKISYKDLLSMTCRIANYLKSIGVKKGDDVTIYMPMVMELPAAMVSMHLRIRAICVKLQTILTQPL